VGSENKKGFKMAQQKIVVVDPDKFATLLKDASSSLHVAKFHLVEIAAEKEVSDEKLATISEYYAALWSFRALLESQLQDMHGLLLKMVEHNLDGLPIQEEVVYQINTFSAATVQLKGLLKSKYNLSMEIH